MLQDSRETGAYAEENRLQCGAFMVFVALLCNIPAIF